MSPVLLTHLSRPDRTLPTSTAPSHTAQLGQQSPPSFTQGGTQEALLCLPLLHPRLPLSGGTARPQALGTMGSHRLPQAHPAVHTLLGARASFSRMGLCHPLLKTLKWFPMPTGHEMPGRWSSPAASHSQEAPSALTLQLTAPNYPPRPLSQLTPAVHTEMITPQEARQPPM